MQCLITALKAESEPLIEFFGLTKDSSLGFPFYYNATKDIVLIGVGVGKKNIKYRINKVFQHFNNSSIQFINIGVAGGILGKVEIGQLFLINKIYDESSGLVFYPDMLTKSSLKEASITTVENVVLDGGNRFNSLVDMEASEVFFVCSKLVSLHNIAHMKIISDHMTNSNNFNYQMISKLIRKNLSNISLFIEHFKCLCQVSEQLLLDRDKIWVESNKEKYLFTESQINQLLKSVKAFKLKNPNNVLPHIKYDRPSSKNNGKKILQKIREKLKT